MAALDREFATYNAQLDALLDHANEYVLIKDTTVLGFFDTKIEALTEGYRLFLDEAFLVRKIEENTPIRKYARPLLPG